MADGLQDPVARPPATEEKLPAVAGEGESSGITGSSDEETQYPRGFPFLLLSIGLMAVVLQVALDNYIIATAIPTITAEFHSLNLVGWYGSSYFLTLMSFQPAFGQLCTIFPIKTVYLTSILIFEVGSIVSATAHAPVAFIIGRLISGAAGGGLWCGTLTLIAYSVPPIKRHLYVSVVTSMYGVASVLGPVLGGVFTDSARLTWRFCFWLNLPIGGIAFILIILVLNPPPPSQLALSLSVKQKIARIDVGGVILLLGAFVCFLSALQWGGGVYAWTDSRVWGCLLGFGLLLLAFVVLQVILKDRATIPLRVITKRTAVAGCAFTAFISMAIGVQVQYLPFYFQSVLGTSASQSGIRTLPYLMTLLFCPMITGYLIGIVGYYVPFMLAGTALMAVGSGLLITMTPSSGVGQWVGFQFLAAFGAGFCRQIAFSAVPMAFSPDDFATTSALVAFFNSLGPTLAIAIGQSIFTSELQQRLAGVVGIDVATIVRSGAVDLTTLVPGPLLGFVREAFNLAVTRALVLAIPGAGAALCASFAVEWVDVRH